MSDLSNAVRATVSEECLTTKCQKRGCKVSLPNSLRPFILIDMDHSDSPAPGGSKRCDFLFIGEYRNQEWVVPLELKRGKADASEIVPQLRAGASVAEGIVPDRASVKFQPVAAYGGELKRHQWNLFRNKSNWVKFGNQREGVRLIRCGASLEQALKSP